MQIYAPAGLPPLIWVNGCLAQATLRDRVSNPHMWLVDDCSQHKSIRLEFFPDTFILLRHELFLWLVSC